MRAWSKRIAILLLVGITAMGVIPFVLQPKQADAVTWQPTEEAEYRHYHGLGWWQEPENELRYAHAMGYKYVFLEKSQAKQISNSPYKKNLNWYYNDVYKHVRPLSSMSLSAGTLSDLKSRYPNTFVDWPEMSRALNIPELNSLKSYNNAVYMEIKNLYETYFTISNTTKSFPDNLLGLRWSSEAYEPFYDFQKQSVITFLINRIKEDVTAYDDPANNFLFTGIMQDVPEMYKEADYNVLPANNTTYKAGWFEFLRQLKDDLIASYPTRSIKFVFEPYRVLDWVNDVNGTSYSSADKKKILGDYLSAESIQDVVTNPAITGTGLLANEDVGSSTPDFNPTELNYTPYALPLLGELASNGKFFNWYGRPGPEPYSTSKADHDASIMLLSDAMKLARILPNWENLNGVLLSGRSWNKTTLSYSSSKSVANKNVIAARRPGTNMIYAHFLNSSGTIPLQSGESVVKVMRVNEYMEPTVSGAADLSVSGSTVSINWASAYDRKTYIIYTSVGNELLSNGSFEDGVTTGWTYAGGSQAAIDGSTYDNKALNVTGRTSASSGVTQVVTAALQAGGMANYNVSARVKMGTGSDTMKLGFTLTTSAGTVDRSVTVPVGSSWTTLIETIPVTWSGTLTDAKFYIQTTGTTNDFQINEITVKKDTGGDVVSNGDFESGTSGWYVSGAGTIAAGAEGPKQGSGYVTLTGRQSASAAVNMTIYKKLLELGMGTYSFSGWSRMSAGTDNVKLSVAITDDTGWHKVNGPTFSADTSWKSMSGTIALSWTGTLKDAYAIVETTTTTNDLSLDDLSLGGNELLTDRDFEFGVNQYWWKTGTGAVLKYDTEPRTFLKHTGRTITWHGPSQDIQDMLLTNGQGNYTLSFEGRVDSGTPTMTAKVKLVDANGSRIFPLTLNATTAWGKVTGSVNLTWSNLTYGQLYIESSSATADLYVDQVSLTKTTVAATLLGYSDFTGGTGGMTANGSSISTYDSVYFGNKALRISGRTQNYQGAYQSVLNTLQASGSGNYKVASWVKLGSGTDTVRVTIKLQYGTGSPVYKSVTVSADTEWKELAGMISNVNTSGLTAADLYFQTDTLNTADLYIDQVSLVKG
ncbi:carbohydrate binding domain-containing protein [Paenibacillus roseipurpureus]|uniref:Carbohydrate binding domain-containing protein n=1 Tax=Paenibacillus roseopurpureus TaxID=2918901 RepID=A0AA96RM69_9BACL|nr:carbohydrate binding domain-containing protein [Paenibacillus sp. MBLB1832]WNR46144.1 carbohydrate binding domain-containing protein [Paenibacillus sp. MBLB1832]